MWWTRFLRRSGRSGGRQSAGRPGVDDPDKRMRSPKELQIPRFAPNDIGAWREARCPLKPKEGLNGPPSALMAA